MRGIKYGTDYQSQTYGAGSNLIPASGMDNVEITGSIDSQASTTLGTTGARRGTLKIKGSGVNLTLASNAVLKFATGVSKSNSGVLGLLKTGGGTSTISGSGTAGMTFVDTGTCTQADFRVDTAEDVLAVNVPVTTQANARPMKSGAGRLVLSGGFSTGSGGFHSTYINSGTLEIGGSGTWNSLTASSLLKIASGATFVLDSTTALTYPGVISGGGA